jgi:hypothetical protein
MSRQGLARLPSTSPGVGIPWPGVSAQLAGGSAKRLPPARIAVRPPRRCRPPAPVRTGSPDRRAAGYSLR